ncbi:MAG TPA: hypothetical protein VIU39_11745 [Anaerolineales bacterium]
MNQFYYETRAKEKVRELMQEGQHSQAFHRSGAPKLGLFPSLKKLMLRIFNHKGAQMPNLVKDAHTKTVHSEYGA